MGLHKTKTIEVNNLVNINTFSNNVTVNKFKCFYLGAIIFFLLSFSLFIPRTTIAEEVSSKQSKINVLSDRAKQAYFSGNYQAAIAIWSEIVDRQEPESNQLAVVYDNLASVHWLIAKPGEAVRYWQKSIEIYRKQETDSSAAKLAATLTDTARAYNDLGQPRLAISLLTEAISLANGKQLAKVKDIAYLALGNAYTIQGNYGLAIKAYNQSLDNIEQIKSDLPIVVWNNLSKAYQQQALIAQQKAIARDAEGELSAPQLWQQAKSDRASAWQAAKQAIKVRKNSQSPAQVEALIQMARLAQDDATKSDDAVASLLKAEVILSALPDSQHKVNALIELGKLTQDYDSRSKLLLQSAVKIAQKIDNPRVLASATGAMGRHYESQQQYKQALYWTKQAQFAAQQIQALDSLYQWDWQAARIYHVTGETEAAIESYQRAIASLQLIRSSTAQAEADPLFSFQSDIEPIYRGLIKLLSENPSKGNLQLALQTKDLLLVSELESFFQDDCFELETYNEADRFAYLKQTNTAVVNTIILNDKIYLIWQFPNGEVKKYAVNISQTELEKLVTQWRFDLENKENDNYLALSQKLYKLLFPSEIKSDLELTKPKNLIFVNDGILRNVPMAALHDGQKFLVENYAVTNSLGLNIQVKKASSNARKAVAFGLTEATAQFPPLPYVKQEIEKLGELVDEKEFLNDKFSYQNFKQQIESSKSSIVHIATHGQFGGTLENTFLQAYKSQISLNKLEEILSSRNISFPDDPIQLLVLSACDTAASNTRATLGMSGVAVKAGVSNVLGSLWSVNDQQIVSLVDGFYRNWIQDGLSESEALQQAQLDLIKSPNYHPSNWASLLLIQG
jgi:CHAT domain-containing protein